MSVGTPSSGGVSYVGGTVLSVCDGLTYTQLLDHGYGLTPITPSNSQELSPITPQASQVWDHPKFMVIITNTND